MPQQPAGKGLEPPAPPAGGGRSGFESNSPATGTETAVAPADSAKPTPPVVLTPLTSIRFFAALHIFLFHLQAMAPQSKHLGVFASMHPVAARLLRRGYCSTSLFFLISGFILAYLYIDPQGQMSVSKRRFWVARFARVYPLHLLLLAVLAPIVIGFASMFGMTTGDLVASGLLSAALLQAWVPMYALSWNFATWALSAVAFFYVAFPWFVQRLRRMSARQMTGWLIALPIVSLVPTIVFLILDPDQNYPIATGNPMAPFWREFVMRTPLFWLPHFAMGMLLARRFRISRYEHAWRPQTSGSLVSWGDGSFLVLLLIALFLTHVPLPTGDWVEVPNLILRHGTLAPLYYVLLYDLARNRGLLSRLLSLPALRVLGDASFSIFMWQLLAMVALPPTAAAVGLGPWTGLLAIVAVTVGVSLLSANLAEKPVSAWLRNQWAAG